MALSSGLQNEVDVTQNDEPPRAPVRLKQLPQPKLAQIMGPGLIAGAADDDPSGIATYSQAGAQFGYALGWTLVLAYPLMVCIQEISARIGRVTGRGIAGNIRRSFSPWLLYPFVGLLCAAKIINIGADLGAMAAAVNLLIGGPTLLYVAAFAVTSVALQTFIRYARYAFFLKFLTLSLFAYVATLFIAHVPWGEMLHRLVVPDISLDASYLTAVVAVLGTTISPYLFFWQAEEEVDEIREDAEAKPLRLAADQAPGEFRRIRLDTIIGMGFANVVALAIMVTTAATLHQHGITDIQTSSQAAEALRPIAGRYAFFLFAAGVIGTGLLALPVLAGSAAYAVGEAFRWPVGLDFLLGRAKGFYGAIALVTALGAVLNFTPIDAIKALFWSAVINGIAAAPIMAIMMVMTQRKKVMGDFVLPPMLRLGGWIATLVMAAACIAMFATWGH